MEGQSSESHADVDTKTKIFKVAAHLFAEKGYNGVSMREISEQTGMSKPTIYYYFGSKEGLYRDLVDTGNAHVLANFERIRSLKITVKEKLVELMKSYFRECIQHPEFIKFFLTSQSSDSAPYSERSVFADGKPWHLLADLINEGLECGEFGASAKPMLAAEIVGGVITHFLLRQLNSRQTILSDQLAEEAIEMLFKGLNE